MGDWRRNHRGARVRRREPPMRRSSHLARRAAGEISEVRFTQSVSMTPRRQMTREQILVGWNERWGVQSTPELSRKSTNKRAESVRYGLNVFFCTSLCTVDHSLPGTAQCSFKIRHDPGNCTHITT